MNGAAGGAERPRLAPARGRRSSGRSQPTSSLPPGSAGPPGGSGVRGPAGRLRARGPCRRQEGSQCKVKYRLKGFQGRGGYSCGEEPFGFFSGWQQGKRFQ